jgi:hypothetical protein
MQKGVENVTKFKIGLNVRNMVTYDKLKNNSGAIRYQ